jgi:hypothetical protein
MTWLIVYVVTYLMAGGTIARMAWEFDVFTDLDSVRDWRDEAALCWMLVLVWPIVPALLAWSYFRIPRR